MFDVVKYTSNKLEREMMVPSHMDPGVFSFSVYSNAPGLEMLDLTTKQWIKVPLDVGIIWCGVAANEASETELKGAYHRVTQHSDYPRLTFWYEVCTRNQVLDENIKPMKKIYDSDYNSDKSSNYSDISSDDMMVEDMNKYKKVVVGKKEIDKMHKAKHIENYTVNVSNKMYIVHANMKVYELQQMVEMATGLSMSKMMVYSRLTSGGKPLDSNSTLYANNIGPGSILALQKSHSPFFK